MGKWAQQQLRLGSKVEMLPTRRIALLKLDNRPRLHAVRTPVFLHKAHVGVDVVVCVEGYTFLAWVRDVDYS